jgi:hypothetical protein
MSKVNFEKEIKSNFKRVQEAIIKDRVNFIFSNYFDTFKCYNNNTFNNQNSCLIANVDMQKHHLYDQKKPFSQAGVEPTPLGSNYMPNELPFIMIVTFKKRKEMGVGVYLTGCLFTKPSQLLTPLIRLIYSYLLTCYNKYY